MLKELGSNFVVEILEEMFPRYYSNEETPLREFLENLVVWGPWTHVSKGLHYLHCGLVSLEEAVQ